MNFHFTQISDKTKYMILSPKTMFLGHFCPMGNFSKTSGCHTQLYMCPYHHSKKSNEPIPSILTDREKTDGRTDGRTDGQTLFYRTLPAEEGGPKKNHLPLNNHFLPLLKLLMSTEKKNLKKEDMDIQKKLEACQKCKRKWITLF